MIVVCVILLLLLCLILKIGICLFLHKHGKISYKNFSALGFAYDEKKDIFYSTKNAWQKDFGYSHIYDVAAPIGSIIVDTEPVHFFYNERNWLISFWKGQYGITTGAEIGIYYTEDAKIHKNTIYKPAIEDTLDMCFILYKKEKEIMRICANHWWLAGFKLGMFSHPKELSMYLQITFPNKEMLNTFLNSFQKLKYKTKEYKVCGNIFLLKYKKPHTKKVWTRSHIINFFMQQNNKRNVKLYHKYLEDMVQNKNDLPNEKYFFLNDYIPGILKNDKEFNLIQNPQKKEKNLTILRDDIYSTVGGKPYEK